MKTTKWDYLNIATFIIMVAVFFSPVFIPSAMRERMDIRDLLITAMVVMGVIFLGTFIILRKFHPKTWNSFKKASFAVLIAGMVGVIGAAYYYFAPWTYPNWSAEKKMAYQFMLMERKLFSNPEKCNRATVVIQKENWKSDYDTISPTETKKLMVYPANHSTKIVLPFTEFGNDCQLSLEKYDGKVRVSIIKPIIIKRVFDAGYSVTATTRCKVGTQEYPYAQGNLEGGMFAVFKQIPDEEFDQLSIEGLEKANKILKKI